MIKTSGLLFVLFVVVSFCRAQDFGGSRPATKWRQINTPQARIIFPEGIDSIANKIAENIYFIAPHTLGSIGSKTKKINIVLRNEGLLSNGYVSLLPFRSEFYLTSPQNAFALGSTPWPDLLSAHEYRHVQQDANFNVGLSHLLKIFFGYGGQALGNAGSVPDWFYEGDAVYIESNVSRQGRGALPYFYNGFRALIRDGRNYRWMKLRNGSYLHYTPDKYTLGFMLTAYGREKYGLDVWKNITHDAASFKTLIYPFQNALKRYTGETFKDFRDSTFQFFNRQFQDSVIPAKRTAYWQEENFPVFDTANHLIYLKSSVKDVPRFVIRKDGKEKIIRVADYMIDDYFSYRNGKIIYASRRYHPRWVSQAFNEIQVLDVATGIQKTITKRTRYLSPDIDDNGTRMVAVNAGTNGAVSLHLLDASSGNLIRAFSEPDIINYAYPKFYGESIIAAVTNRAGKMSIAQTDIASGSIRYLLPFTDNVLGFPWVKNDTLYFSISQKLNDELFAYSFSAGKFWKVVSDETSLGKYHVAVGKDWMVWSSFTPEGQRLQWVSRDKIHFEEVNVGGNMPAVEANGVMSLPTTGLSTITSSFGLSSLNNVNSNRLYRLGDSIFASRRYRQLTRPFNFYSLEPQASDPDYTFTLVGENVLNTVQTSLSATYNRADHSKQVGIDVSYAALFPVLSFGYNYDIDRRFVSKDEFIYYNISSPYVGFSIPLNFSSKRHFRRLSFGSNAGYKYLAIQKPFKSRFRDASYTVLTNFISFANQSQTALAQVLPRFAQTFSFNYKVPVSGPSGYQYQAAARLYLPGLFKTHSLNFAVAYSQKDTMDRIGFSSSFPFSRGYEAVNLHKMFTWQANYQFPFLYPEVGTANVVYLMRVRTNLFYDQTIVNSFTDKGEKWRGDFNSAGAELFFDTKWWNQTAASIGVRYSYLMDRDMFGEGGHNRWEIILPVNLLNKR